jgi:hypothetical protein
MKRVTLMYFDANMRYFERECRFKAKVGHLSKDSELFSKGVRKGHLIECMLPNGQPEDDEHVMAEVYLPDGSTVCIHSSEDLSIGCLEFEEAIQIPGMNAMDTGYLKSIGIVHE